MLPKTFHLLAASACLLSMLVGAACVQAQNGAPVRDEMRNDAAAKIDVPVTTGTAPVPPPDAPMIVPLKTTNYSIPADALFVSPGGSAASDGKHRDRPTTVQKAIATAPAGATIIFRGGTYRGLEDVRPARRLTLQAFPGEKPWIVGSIVVSGWTRDAAPNGTPLWRHDAWPHRFAFTWGKEYIDPQYPLAGERDMVWLGERYLTQVGALDQMAPGKFFVDGAAKKLYIGDDPAGRTVEATAHKRALVLHTVDKGALATAGAAARNFAKTIPVDADPSGTIIRGLGFARYADHGMILGAANVRVEDCTFAWNGQYGVDVAMHVERIKGLPVRGVQVRGSTFLCNGRVGLHVSHAPGLRVEECTIAHNNVERYRNAWDAAGTKIVYTPNLRFHDNLVERNYASGVWLDISADEAVITRNLVRHNGGIGIFFEISRGAIIAFNVCHDNGAGIQLSNATRARVWNNTLVNNNTAFFAQQWTRLNTDPWPVAGVKKGGQFVTRANEFVNNLVAVTRKVSRPLLNVSGDGGPSREKVTRLEGNVYYFGPDAQMPAFALWSQAGGKQAEIASLAEFQRASGLDDGAARLSQVFFVSAEKGDFRQAKPLRNAGSAPLPDDIADVAHPPNASNVAPPGRNGAYAGAYSFPEQVGSGN